ncbi:MAG: protein kinase [Gemmatimonadetes bacterium]|nr:protein kinase [Gemmatimonadota bacterium]
MTPIDQLKSSLAGRYEIDREIGRGGMATVYLARDLKHERKVALKVLHPDLAAALGAERFLAEIRTTANLQHPHILPLHDSGEADGYLFYVMPFVAGETLRARLERENVLPIDDALRISREVLSALDYAHRHGVVHRDIKPENILLHDGSALVADFGIALAVQSAGGQRMTQTGLSLGTPQYMSPEQAMGERQIDGRADVYAIGAVLYEMLTGEPPFSGASVQAIVAKVMTERPMSPRIVRDTVPANVEAAVMRALAKLPADRFATAKDFSDELSNTRVPQERPAAPKPRRAPAAAVAVPWALAIIGVGVALWSLRRSGDAAGEQVARLSVDVPDGERLTMDTRAGVDISRDGQQLVYVADSAGQSRLYVRPLGDLVPHVMANTAGANFPRFSPDGRWIAFIVGNQLLKIPSLGGPSTVVADSVARNYIDWSPAGDIIFTRYGIRPGLSRIASAGTSRRVVTHSDSAHGQVHVRPRVLDDRRTIVFINAGPGGTEDDYLAIGSLESGEFTVTKLLAALPLGFVDGHVLYSRADGVIMAVPVDLARRSLTGDAVPLVDAASHFAAALSANGTLLTIRGMSLEQLAWVDQHGVVSELPVGPQSFFGTPRISPDGRRIAVAIGRYHEDPSSNVWLIDLASAVSTRLSTGNGLRPDWTRDGHRVTFLFGDSTRRKHSVSRAADLSDQEKPDVPAGTVVIAGTPGAIGARLSPDGRRVTYALSGDGRTDVYVQAFPTPGGVVQVSANGGDEPMWTRDGRRIVYREGQRFMSAELAPGKDLSVVSRAPLFAGNFARGYTDYDIAPDDRLLVVRSVGVDERLTMTLNWLSEARRAIAHR